jgi:alkylation response protein AidB-like acyl-CoA dehydrogenase
LIEGDDLKLFAESLRGATESHSGAPLDAALDDLGWQEALDADAGAAVSLLFELQGAANSVSSALGRVLASALGYEATAVVLPALGQCSAPGWMDGGRLDGGRLAVRGLGLHGLGLRGLGMAGTGEHGTALVVARAGDSHLAVQAETASLTLQACAGIDPDLGLCEVTGEAVAARVLGPADWRHAVALGQLALGHEMVGASRRMLELACEHARERIQFGRPIATFQAVRYRLAETLVAIDQAAAMLDAAWLDGAPQTAGMAKAAAGRGARIAARHCQQVLAGIGFTVEHPFHRYVRRIMVLEQLLGATRSLTRDLGSEILTSGQLPALQPL